MENMIMYKNIHCVTDHKAHCHKDRDLRIQARSTTTFTMVLMIHIVVVSILPTLTLAEIYKVPLEHRKGSGELNQAVNEEGAPSTSPENNLHGKPGQGYYISMSIGQPSQQLNVLVDTGSSNFAVAASPDPNINKYFDISKSLTFRNIGTKVYVPYTKGNWKGHLGEDTVSIASVPHISITANIACITSSDQFYINASNWQGILGLAYSDISRPDSSVEPFFDSLVKQTNVSNDFSLQLCGTIDTNSSVDVAVGGTMVIGGLDASLYTGSMLYAAIHKEWYYEVVLTQMKVGKYTIDVDCKELNFDKAIVDSGTTNLRLPKKIFNRVKELIKDNTHLAESTPPDGFWSGDDILCWQEGLVPFFAFPDITISLAQSRNSTISLVMAPQQYLRAVSGEEEDVKNGKDCFKFAIATSDTGTVLGAVLMEGYYVHFDRTNHKVGFAKTTCPNRDPSSTGDVKGPYESDFDTYHCAYVKPASDRSTLTAVAYVMAGICAACLLPLVAMIIHWQYHRCRGTNHDILPDISSLLKNEDR